jgi:hypothetical protein
LIGIAALPAAPGPINPLRARLAEAYFRQLHAVATTDASGARLDIAIPIESPLAA